MAEKGVGVAPGVVVGGRVRAPVRCPGCGQARWGLSVIPSPRLGGMECCDRCGRSGSISGGDLARGGGHDVHDPRPTAVVGRSCVGRLQATDMPVAQSVEDEGEQFAGGGDHTDIASAAGSDLVADLPEPGAFTDSLDGLDGGPADQFAALLGNPPAVDLGVGLMGVEESSRPSWSAGWVRGSGAHHRFRRRTPRPGSRPPRGLPGSRCSRGGHAAGR